MRAPRQTARSGARGEKVGDYLSGKQSHGQTLNRRESVWTARIQHAESRETLYNSGKQVWAGASSDNHTATWSAWRMMGAARSKESPRRNAFGQVRPAFTGFRTGSGRTVFPQQGHESLACCNICFKCAHVVTFCNILSH